MALLRSRANVLSRALPQCRSVASYGPNDEVAPILTNRNPRNLEKIRIAYKPSGYHLEKRGRLFWHRLDLSKTSRYATASVVHFENGEVLQASTKEWAIKKFLYNPDDVSAYINLGRVLAQRCLEFGITELMTTITPDKPDGKVALFLKAVQDGGLKLEEPQQFKPHVPWDLHRPEKPWNVTE